MRAADGLFRLPNRLGCDGAAIDHDPVLAGGRRVGDGFRFREVEAAAQRDGLDAHDSASRSSSPQNTWVAEPRMQIGSPGAQAIVSAPPGIVTLSLKHI